MMYMIIEDMFDRTFVVFDSTGKVILHRAVTLEDAKSWVKENI